MNNCKNCGSFAVNHHCHGRNGDDADLCDVCYWRKRADAFREDAERYRWLRKAHDSTDSVTLWHVRGTGGQPIESGSLDADIDAAMR